MATAWLRQQRRVRQSTTTEEEEESITIPFTEASFWNDYLDGGLRILVNLFVALVLAVIFSLIIMIICRIIRKVAHFQAQRRKAPLDTQQEQLLEFIISGVKLLLWIQIVPILVSTVGIAADSIIAILGALTVGIGLSLRPIAENFVMGIVLTLNRPFSVGDMVLVADKIKGKVQKMFFAYTILQEPDGTVVHVPNAKIALNPMSNLSSHPTCRLDVGRFDLAHGANLAVAREIMTKATLKVDKVVPEPAPNMIVLDVSQTAIVVACRFWCESSAQLAIQFPVRQAICEAFRSSTVPLASWGPEVATTLEKMADLGYPGLGRSVSSGWVPPPPPPDGIDPAEEMAAAASSYHYES